MKNNVPFDVAFSLDSEDMAAWSIVFGEQEGGVFDYRTGKWREPNA